MGKPVRVPDPVYERLERESDRKDCARGEIVRDWMEAAQKWERLDKEMIR